MPYMENCGNCRWAKFDEEWENLECKNKNSDCYGDWVDGNYNCSHWEGSAEK